MKIPVKIRIQNFLFLSRFGHYLYFWQKITRIWQLFHQQYELDSLVSWAKRKRLSKVGQYYRSLLDARELSLLQCRWQSPQLVNGIWLLFSFYEQLFLWGRTYQAGFARKYKIQRVYTD